MIACNRRPHCYAALLLQMSAFLLGPCLLNVHWAPLLCCIAPSGDHISAPAVSAQRRHGCFNRTTTGHAVMTGCHSRPHCYAALLLSKFLLPPLLNVDSAASRSMTGCSLTVCRSKALVHNKAADTTVLRPGPQQSAGEGSTSMLLFRGRTGRRKGRRFGPGWRPAP